MKKKYTNKNITITWEPEKCVHSTNCWKGLVGVFNPKAKPWVNLGGADDEKIVDQVLKYPSGALGHFYNSTGKPREQKVNFNSGAMVAAKEPKKELLEAGKPYAWCACGRSEKQSFCDGTHLKTDLKPLVFKPKQDGDAWLCQCKKTSTPPYCDGTHNKLA